MQLEKEIFQVLSLKMFTYASRVDRSVFGSLLKT